MGIRRRMGLSMVGVAGLLSSVIMTASPSEAALFCVGSAGANVASIQCTGGGPGTFYVEARFCSHEHGCYLVNGNRANLSGGTSTARGISNDGSRLDVYHMLR
jgi:hypothetical protein